VQRRHVAVVEPEDPWLWARELRICHLKIVQQPKAI
jgi:hypothetical protein